MSDERNAEVEASFEPAATIEERRARIKRAREEVRRMCIPVQPDDTDIVLSAVLTDAMASLNELEYAQAEVKGERITNEFIEAERDAALAEAAKYKALWAALRMAGAQ